MVCKGCSPYMEFHDLDRSQQKFILDEARKLR